MKNQEFEFYHGLAILQIIKESNKAISIQIYKKSKSFFIINNAVAIFIKHSSKRASPWPFTFEKGQQEELAELHNQYKEVFLILVCNEDGIACLNHSETKTVLGIDYKKAKNITVKRRKNEHYKVRGASGELEYKINSKDFAKRILDALHNENN